MVIILAVIVLAAVFVLAPFEAVHRGFFCDDESIHYPFREDTITVTVLIITTFLPVFLLVSTSLFFAVNEEVAGWVWVVVRCRKGGSDC